MHKAKGREADVVFVAPTFNGVEPASATKVYHDDEGERIVQVGDLEPELEKRWEAERREAAGRLLYVAITRARSRVYLPYLAPLEGGYPMSCEPGGTFRVAVRALEPIVEGLERGEERELFQRRRPALLRFGRRGEGATGGEVDLSGWSPPEDLLEVPLDPGDYRRLRRRTSEVVSFSRLSTDRDDERRGLGGDGNEVFDGDLFAYADRIAEGVDATDLEKTLPHLAAELVAMATGLADTHLVLLGDADQLSSVESGAVFRELVSASCATETPWRELAVDPVERQTADAPTARSTVRLTESYRMAPDRPRGRQILEVARSLNAGKTDELREVIRDREAFEEVASDGEAEMIAQGAARAVERYSGVAEGL
ncbi:MAG: 3'-5' exonuclease [Bradymonadaceae bacterium]